MNLNFDENMLNHEKIVNSDPEIKFDNITPQMRKPIYLDAIDAWMGNLPREVDTSTSQFGPISIKFKNMLIIR